MNTLSNTGDTICAIATRVGGAITVIRVSGPHAIGCTDRLFHPHSGKPLAAQKAGTMHYGTVCDIASGHTIDDVVAAVWRAPRSYTGDDTVEISCHGSQYIAQTIVHNLVEAGCRMAGPGEFTMRAYLNGKMDLSQAEAVADLIAAGNKASHDLAISQLKGHFSQELATLRSQLLKLTSLLELELDFSDHEELEFADRTQIDTLTATLLRKVTSLCSSFRTGQALRKGIAVAIVGKTNVGKSTLLNCLLEEDKAIVSDISGTTRDTIDGVADIRGVSFRFTDTAGLRTTTDTIEQIGIERAYRQIEQAAVVMWVIDAMPTADEQADIMRRADGKPVVVVHNKADISLHTLIAGEVAVSAKTGRNIDALKHAIYDAADLPEISDNTVIITNTRHYEALSRAADDLQRVADGLATGLPTDLLAEDLRLCLADLADITGGQITPQETLNNIFQHFCIGK